MAKIEIKDALFPDCPIRNILSRIGDKWSLLVLYTLSGSSVMRFNVLQKNIPDISQKMLTVTLSPRRRRIGKKSDLCRGSPEGRILFDRPGEIFVALY